MKVNDDDWVDVYHLNNCFNDKNKKHFGLKYKDSWYVVTHASGGIIIPTSCLNGFNQIEKTSYLKLVINSAPNKLKKTNKKIHKSIIENYSLL